MCHLVNAPGAAHGLPGVPHSAASNTTESPYDIKGKDFARFVKVIEGWSGRSVALHITWMRSRRTNKCHVRAIDRKVATVYMRTSPSCTRVMLEFSVDTTTAVRLYDCHPRRGANCARRISLGGLRPSTTLARTLEAARCPDVYESSTLSWRQSRRLAKVHSRRSHLLTGSLCQ